MGGLLGRLVAGPIAEIAGWRTGVLAVALLCGAAAVAFVKLAPPPRGYRSTAGARHADGSLGRRLAANLRSPRQLTLYAQAFLLMGAASSRCTTSWASD